MNNDPANARARARNALQLARELEKKRKSLSHPGGGGTRGYAVWFRQTKLEKKLAGQPTIASDASLRRWEKRIHPHRMTGNKQKRSLLDLP